MIKRKLDLGDKGFLYFFWALRAWDLPKPPSIGKKMAQHH